MVSASPVQPADVVLVGGGLANSLIALRLKSLRPRLRVLMLERGARIGGEQVWRHFATDVDPDMAAWLRPLIVHQWSGYEVRFPTHGRRLETAYLAVTAQRLRQALGAALGDDLWLDAAVSAVSPHQVTLADGRVIAAAAVIDGRGPRKSRRLTLGWRRVLGQSVRLAAPHGLSLPILMDATVSQADGGRFVQVLPLDPHRLLIEDSRDGDGPELDRPGLRAANGDYAAAQGWRVVKVEREMQGVLPVALGGDIDAYWTESRSQLAEVGLRAALFHPTTGYALPDAARLAERIADLPRITSATVRACVEEQSKILWRRRRVLRLFNRLLFRACAPADRYRVLQRLHRLPVGLIQRFHAARLTHWDKARLLIGLPPAPLKALIRALRDESR